MKTFFSFYVDALRIALQSIFAHKLRAFLTLIDTHVTTVVSCAFLFIFGSGPVKGFAVTLTIGLISNMFTAVFVSRTLFDYSLDRDPQMTSLSI